MLRRLIAIPLCLTAALAAAQQATSQQAVTQQPQVKVNMLNVCAPSAADQKEIAAALARIPKQPIFSSDFEVDRGRSSMDQPPSFLQAGAHTQMSTDTATATWVRIRHEYAVQALFSSVQYSFSLDAKNMVETLVFHVRDPKDLMSLAIEDSASAVVSPAAMLATNTPATHIKLERFGKSSIVLARCYATEQGPAPDQSIYEPLFSSATSAMTSYRGLLDAKRLVPEELSRTGASPAPKAAPGSKLQKPAKIMK